MANRTEDTAKKDNRKIVISVDGPYWVYGKVKMDKQIIGIGADGEPAKWLQGDILPTQEEYALCRCGKSKEKPFCDMSHVSINFNGTETATRKPYMDQADIYKGVNADLADAPVLCASARFCHRAGGTWDLIESKDPKAVKIAAEEACDCPSGRLVLIDKKTGKPIKCNPEAGLSFIEDPQEGVSGPIWVKGGIPIESEDGTKYEPRENCTLCRCGNSENKPFCDSSHIDIGFNDGDKNLKKDKKP